MEDSALLPILDDALRGAVGEDAADVQAGVADGVVTVTGHVRTHARKFAIERAILRLEGVRALVQRVEVGRPARPSLTDEQIARRVAEIVEREGHVPPGSVEVIVEDGNVVLRGRVPCETRKAAVSRAVAHLVGNRGAFNLLSTGSAPRDCLPAGGHHRSELSGQA